MRQHELTPDADEDLESIIRYTLSEWGFDQAEKYASQLSQCFEQIANRKIIGRGISSALKGVEFTRCEHHYVFYQIREKKPVLIVAVLHEKMDLMTRLRDRLEQ